MTVSYYILIYIFNYWPHVKKPDLFYYHGLALYHIGQLGAAISAFAECTKSRSSRPEVLRIHAQALKEAGKFDEAALVLNQAHTLHLYDAKIAGVEKQIFVNFLFMFQKVKFYMDFFLTKCRPLTKDTWNEGPATVWRWSSANGSQGL